MEQTNEIAGKDFHGLCFVNLVDFDAKWGHRRDPEGYAKELEQFDKGLSVLLETLREDDLLIITADTGTIRPISGLTTQGKRCRFWPIPRVWKAAEGWRSRIHLR